jgi:hypothetical protein
MARRVTVRRTPMGNSVTVDGEHLWAETVDIHLGSQLYQSHEVTLTVRAHHLTVTGPTTEEDDSAPDRREAP